MSQISLYIEEETLRKIELAAKLENKSISKWVASKVKSSLKNQWPDDYFSLFGQIKDKTFNEPEDIDFSRHHQQRKRV